MEEHHEKFVEVRVVTTSGVYPEVGFERVPDHEHVITVLKRAAEKLHIKDTAGWIAVVGGRKIDIAKSFRDNGLSGRVELVFEESHEKFVEVRVITTSGVYPEAGFEREPEHEKVEVLLKKANEKLHIADTQGWIAVVASRKIDIAKSFRDNALSGRVEIDWGPDHGAGGYA
jgi:hypothetical protein